MDCSPFPHGRSIAYFNIAFYGGIGKLKGKTFRISNMGDETPETMKELLDNIDAILPELLK